MLIDTLNGILSALGLASSLEKPIDGLLGPVASTVDGLASTVDGVLGGLGLPPILGGLLEVDPTVSNSASIPYYTGAGSSIVNVLQSLANDSCTVEPYTAPALPQGFPAFDEALANVYRYRQQQSVNLGSWFVHEQWMTPSVFACAANPQLAEIDIATGWGSPSNAQAVLERHWDTFITQSDFEFLASIGINTVRLPIGYWSLGPQYCQGTPFEPVASVYMNAWSRVANAINMAGQAGIGVLVDLHGAPGSQNGLPQSGISDGQANLFNSTLYQQQTVNVLSYLVQQLASVSNVVGIELLNEPSNVPELSDFYTNTIATLREISSQASSLPIYVQDAFDLQRFSDFVAARTDFVVEDHHSYFVYSQPENTTAAAQDTTEVQTSISDQLSAASDAQRGNLIVGEWSCALTPQSLANTTDQLTVRQLFCEGQEQTYANTTAGWGFWTYNLEDCSTDLDWCFINIVGKILPSSFFSYNRASTNTPAGMEALALEVANMLAPSATQILGYAYSQGNTQPAPSTSAAIAQNTSSSTELQSGISRTAHRFSSIYSRRRSHPVLAHKRDNSTSSDMSLTPTETAITRGYSDGFLTGKIYAQYNLSRLGFVGQYIQDSLTALGPSVIEPGQEPYYMEWFNKGLSDAEYLIAVASST